MLLSSLESDGKLQKELKQFRFVGFAVAVTGKENSGHPVVDALMGVRKG